MHIDDAGHDGLACGIHPMRLCRYGHLGARSHRRDPILFDHDRPVLDNGGAAIGDRDDPRADERDATGRFVRARCEADLDAGRLGLCWLCLAVLNECKGLAQVPGEIRGTQRPVQAPAVAGPVEIDSGVLGNPCHRIVLDVGSQGHRPARARERRDVDLEPLGEGHPAAVR